MRTIDLIRMGIRNLSRRKARTSLTVIGVVIGTISIVIMISIGIGMNTNFRSMVMELGSLTTITLSKNSYIQNQEGDYQNVTQTIDDKLITSIEGIAGVKAVMPVRMAALIMEAGRYEGSGQVYAVDLMKFGEFDYPAPMSGELPTNEKDAANTVIMGNYIATQGFNDPRSRRWEPVAFDPQKMKLICSMYDWEFNFDMSNMKQYRVENVVLLDTAGNYSESDYSIYMDSRTFEKWYSEFTRTLKAADRKKAQKKLKEYDQLVISVDNVKNVKDVEEQIKEMGYQTQSLSSMMEPMEQTSKMLQLVLGAVGAVAMLVSAISIANTMVMSIYERTKEIGVMKVLGCVIRDIKKLFLFEAGIIGFLGGAIGVVLSYIGSFCINKFGGPVFDALMSSGGGAMYGLEATGPAKYSVIPLWLPLAASAFAILVGLVSGYYPANRATKISAIEAMKSNE
ncbi:ABC transporter permease [Anaerolentibacter hominis]|uniref:ABC transporter permease n=1 Tax=Anaerolentibacter hominis TaxID=3079009 RepID=UPI0031B8474C